MATIDYKQKIKDYMNSGEVDTLYKSMLNNLFPELAKSEDEKIRKELLDFCKNRAEKFPNDPKYKNISAWIAWLEKQSEKSSDKIVEKARTEKQRVLLTETDGSANIDWDCRSLNDVKILLKCGLEFIHTIEANKQILTGNRFGGCSFRIPTRYDKGIKQGEQKSRSEEYEAVLDALIRRLEGEDVYVSPHLAVECLKSLKDRVQPQSAWKPSDEQMDALEAAIVDSISSIQKHSLESLYNELKKL